MNIASIMAKVLPGTFVPDMSSSESPTVSAIPGLGTKGIAGSSGSSDDGTTAVAGPSFKETLQGLLAGVNDSLSTSDKNMRDLATGKTNDVDRVVTSVEEANLSLQYTMAIRTKLLEAYTSIQQMQV